MAENNEGSPGPVQLDADQLDEIVDRLADLLKPAQAQAAVAPVAPVAGGQASTMLKDTSPVFSQYHQEQFEETAMMLEPLFNNMALEQVQKDVQPHHLGTEGFKILQKEMSTLKGTQLKNFVASGAPSMMAKAIAYDMLIQGKTTLDAAATVVGGSRDTSGGSAARIEDLSSGVQDEIKQAEMVRGKPYTTEELRELGVLK